LITIYDPRRRADIQSFANHAVYFMQTSKGSERQGRDGVSTPFVKEKQISHISMAAGTKSDISKRP